MTTASTHSPPPPHAASSPKPSSTSRAETANGSAAVAMARPDLNGSASSAYANGDMSRFRPAANGGPDDHVASNDGDDDRRPTSAPGQRNGNMNGNGNGNASLVTRDDIGSERPRRPTKPMLQRSKSEFGPRPQPVEDPEPAEEQVPEWGARHGFEDHYQSEHIISQLANVGRICAPVLNVSDDN